VAVTLKRFIVRIPMTLDVQLDAADGKTALQLVNCSMADGALNDLKIRITPLRGKSFACAHIVKAKAKAKAATIVTDP
jgi:hypothetical protein